MNTRFARVVDADDDQRLDGANANHLVGGAMHVPILPTEGGGAIEKILAVLQVENGKMGERLIVIARRKINDEIATVAQEA